jgi:hypothetical protein
MPGMMWSLFAGPCTFMCGCCIVDGWVVRCRFLQDHIGGNTGEFVVLVDTKYVAEETVVVCC